VEVNSTGAAGLSAGQGAEKTAVPASAIIRARIARSEKTCLPVMVKSAFTEK
jgi:hypothetical protein